MNYKRFFTLVSILLLLSCQKNDEKQLAEQQKDAQAKALIYTKISKGWHFTTPVLNPTTQTMVQNWRELREFNTELNLTPKSSIGAFQKKAKDLSKLALALNNNIPPAFNKPQIKSRITALVTKINSINLFINLDAIPEQKVIALVAEVDVEMLSIYQQMDEIVRKNQIPLEEGESDMIRMLDTARAIPN
jgi:hypothetical protein